MSRLWSTRSRRFPTKKQREIVHVIIIRVKILDTLVGLSTTARSADVICAEIFQKLKADVSDFRCLGKILISPL